MMSDYFGSRNTLAPVTRDELMAALRDMVTLLDVQPEGEFVSAICPVQWPRTQRSRW